MVGWLSGGIGGWMVERWDGWLNGWLMVVR